MDEDPFSGQQTAQRLDCSRVSGQSPPPDPFAALGLRKIELSDRNRFLGYFRSLSEPLSDYTFSQLFTWGNSLRIYWKELRGHLCVFANGTGDLTLLMPPIGDSGSQCALAEAFEVMDAYNGPRGVSERSRVEYVSAEALGRFDRAALDVEPMGTDYVYDVQRMIDLAGGDLASKRQLKNRFMRNYDFRIEPYEPARHRDGCARLLHVWKQQQDATHAALSIDAIKRSKETVACEMMLDHAEALDVKGIVVLTRPRPVSTADCGVGAGDLTLSGFTFGEHLSHDQSSIVIEKTDLTVKGLAQFIFSEFCRMYWSGRPLTNAGDDWGLQNLAWTKMSYRPVKLLQKYVLRQRQSALVSAPSSWHGLPARDVSPASPQDRSESQCAPAISPSLPVSAPPAGDPPQPPEIRPARRCDLAAAVELENNCFQNHRLTKRQLQYLLTRPSAVFMIAEQGGQLLAQGISLVRQHKRGLSGRIYSLGVSPAARGRGLGKALLLRLIDELAGRGVRRIYLEVAQDNHAALCLYQSAAFRSIGLLPHYYGNQRPAIHMMYEVKTPVRVPCALAT